jgi:hypothetical protein
MIFVDISKQEMDPFRYITIASVCMNLYLRFYYPEKTIARLPISNDRMGERTWLAAQALERGVNITPKLGMSGVDDQGRVYRFRYCYDDGCSECFNKMSFHHLQGIKLHELRYMTDQAVEDQKAITIWECEWTIPEESFSPLLNPHDAFFGGRTEPIKLYYKTQPGEKIRYYDYTSLYPSVQSGRLHGKHSIMKKIEC